MYVGIYICSNQKFHRIDKYPFYIGQGNDVDLRLEGPSISDKQCAVHQGRAKPVLQSLVDSGVRLQGQPINDLELAEEIYPVIIGNWCAYIVCSGNLDSWQEKLTNGKWCYYQINQPKSQPQPYRQLLDQFNDTHDPNSFFLANEHTTLAFSLADLRTSNKEYDDNHGGDSLPEPPPGGGPGDTIDGGRPSTKEGEYRCPFCWTSFAAKDFYMVATHPELKKDPHLGVGHYCRFKPTSMAGGKFLDPNGSVATELACPHCHLILPRNIKNTPQKIISVVGDEASGKSYYLSVITKILGDSLPRSFNALYEDATPGGNEVLRKMVNNLWGANTPEEVHIIKTQLYSGSYQEVRIKGDDRVVQLPKAFIFTATNLADEKKRTNLVFYDNAGEHFRPENNSADTPGARHVAQANGIIFLLDPFNHNDFKRKIREIHDEDGGDPQLEQRVNSNPDVILDEMRKRIEELTGFKRRKTPFAFVVGKSDAWRKKLIPNDKKLWDPKVSAKENCSAGLDLGVVEHNSNIIQEMLNDISPGLVARAKAMSDNYMFFGTSNFGHPAVPVERDDPDNPGKKISGVGPDPRKLNPELVDIPVLWILSQTDPGIVNSVRNSNLQL